MIHDSEEEALQPASHFIFQSDPVIFLVYDFPSMVNSLAYFDYVRHGDPFLRKIAYLISLGQDLISFHHHILFDHHAVCLVVLILVQVAVLVKFFHLLG